MPNLDSISIAEEIVRIRLSQILVNEEYKAGKFKVPVHLALGHEASAVAVHHTFQEGDKLVLSHRNIAYNLARLGKLRPILHEYLLKPTGLAEGKLGSMNLINVDRGIIYSSSVLGNNFSVSAGVAMAEKMSGRAGVTYVFGGDGSIEEGGFYESLLLAKTLALRLIFVIENNEWSLGTHISERRCPIDLQKLTSTFDIPYVYLQGNHAHAYIETFQSVRERVVSEDAPMCIEIALKTLGDRWVDQTPERPKGRYINYHAGPTPVVDIVKHSATGVIVESEDDPVFVLKQEIGEEKLVELAERIIKELQKEIA